MSSAKLIFKWYPDKKRSLRYTRDDTRERKGLAMTHDRKKDRFAPLAMTHQEKKIARIPIAIGRRSNLSTEPIKRKDCFTSFAMTHEAKLSQ